MTRWSDWSNWTCKINRVPSCLSYSQFDRHPSARWSMHHWNPIKVVFQSLTQHSTLWCCAETMVWRRAIVCCFLETGYWITRMPTVPLNSLFNPLNPHDASKHHFTSLKIDLILLQPIGFRTKFPTKLVYQYMAIFFNFPPISNHLPPLQVENCGSNSRLVVEEDDNGKFRLERVKIEFT